MLRDLRTVENGCIFPFLAKMGVKVLRLAIALVFIMYNGS